WCYVWVQLVRRGRFALEVLVQDGHRITSCVGRSTSEHLIHHDSQAIDVGAVVDLVILYLLRCHIQGCAEQRASSGQTGRRLSRRSGEAKVDDLHDSSIVDQHILWFEIAMNNLDLMGGMHATANVPEDTQTALGVYRLMAAEFSTQVMTRKVLHGNGVYLL